MYRSEDGQIVVVVPSSGTSTFAASDAGAIGVDVLVETADLERSDIARIKAVVSARNWHSRANDYSSAAWFDARLGKVVLRSDAPAHVYQYFTEQFPGMTTFETGRLSIASRMWDEEAHYGGARIIKPGITNRWCSSGFSVTTNSTGKHRMLTAGHCWPVGTSVTSPLGTSFGSVKNNPWWGAVGDAHDMALIGEGINDVKMGPYIYIGDSVGTKAAVLGADGPTWSTEYCFSGATNYTNCGHYLIDNDVDQCDAGSNACWFNLRVFDSSVGNGSCGGDSGSPFYLKGTGSNVYIRGMVVVGEGSRPEDCPYNQIAGIEIWPKIAAALGVSIKTANPL